MAERLTLSASKKKRGPYQKQSQSDTSRTSKWRLKKQQNDCAVQRNPGTSNSVDLDHDTGLVVNSSSQLNNNDLSSFGGIIDQSHEEISDDITDQLSNDQVFLQSEFEDNNEGCCEESKEPYQNFADGDNYTDFEVESDPDKSQSDVLYDGARLSLSMSMFLTISLVMRHGATGQFFDDLLTLLEMFCPANNNFRGNIHMFKDYFTSSKEPIERNYYCSFCTKFFGKTDTDSCPNCSSTDISYFLSLPLASQLCAILKGKLKKKSLVPNSATKMNEQNVEDVYDGQLYKDHFNSQGFFHGTNSDAMSSEAHISLQINTDGVAIFKSSSFSVWPLYAVINELNPSMRFSRDNRIFMGLWFGKSKPAMNMFLKPFMEEVKTVFNSGVQVKLQEGLKTVRAIILSVIADAPARCLMLNMMQYNGKYGCPCCLATGESCAIGEKGHSRIYPYDLSENSVNGHAETRTHDSTLENAKEAFETFKSSKRANPDAVKGVKGISTLFQAPGLDIIRGTTVDYMHCILLGIMKMMLSLWFDVTNRTKPWSIRGQIGEVNSRLLSINPPNFVNRVPQSLEDLSQWKAAELRSFLLFYSVTVLFGILPSNYLEHFVLLQRAIFILLQESIRQDEIGKARKLLQKFVLLMEELYEERYLTFNVHSLLHLPAKVQDLGPLWSHSCFFYEDLNGDLRSLFHGTNNVQNQIMFAVSLNQRLPEFQKDLESNIEAKSFYDHMTQKRNVNRTEIINEQMHVVGRLHRACLSAENKHLVEREVGTAAANVYAFYRLNMKKYTIHCSEYSNVTKRISYTVLYGENQVGHIKIFLKIILESGKTRYFALINQLKVVSTGTCIDTTENLLAVKKSETFEVVPVELIKDLCIFMKGEDQTVSYVARPPNRIERE